MTHIKRKVVTILKDVQLPEERKLEILRQLEMDCLSKERSATEGMTPVDGDDGEDLKFVVHALRRLGQQPFDHGAATL